MTAGTRSISMPDFLLDLANAADVTWSIATFGAIAEFSRAAGETGQVTPEENGFRIVTPRGALRYHHASAVRILAYEGLSKNPHLWSQGISICLPEISARMSGRRTLDETGLDPDALQERDRACRMFDIGLGAPHVDAFVRTPEGDLASILRRHAGEPLFGDSADALHAILIRSPDRVFTSRLGRIEVATPIANPAGETASGPHTHVLPDLLAHGRTHAATIPIPDGYLPCMNIFPPNPARDVHGDRRAFDEHDHAVFQGILARYGDPAANDVKGQVAATVSAGRGPDSLAVPEGGFSRTVRTALRVALRQLRFTGGHSPALDDWLSVFEPNDGDTGDG